ncbi:MAG: septum site-determining protein MinD [Pseudomonadota bacterium]|nr:septum site-determining protein MinD [Pseudomonadota bacterium]
MAKIIVVTSGKGGVGKTTTSTNFSVGLARQGSRTAVIDFDMGLRNLDLVLGCEGRVVYDLFDLMNGYSTLRQTLIRHRQIDNLYVLPASQTRDKDTLTREGLERIFDELAESFDYIVCDSPAGIEWGAQMALYFADEALIIANPEVSSVRDADRLLRLLARKSRRAELGQEPVREHLVVTRYASRCVEQGLMLSVNDIVELLDVPLLGVIPECRHVIPAANAGTPVILNDLSQAGLAYRDLVARYLGEARPHRFLTAARKGFFRRLLGA